MSDISIRLDGLLLAAVIVGGAAIFAVIGLVSALRTLLTKPPGVRSWKTALYCVRLVVAHGIALAVLIAYLSRDGSATPGADWIDWLALPWSCVVLVGLILLLRSRTAKADRPIHDRTRKIRR